MMGPGVGTGMGTGWVFWLLLVAGVVLVVVVVVRMIGGGVRRDAPSEGAGRGSAGSSRARDVLDERYARGELSTEEYRERLATLRGER